MSIMKNAKYATQTMITIVKRQVLITLKVNGVYAENVVLVHSNKCINSNNNKFNLTTHQVHDSAIRPLYMRVR